ncbi:acyl carrier protein [Paenibacillus massiliensis]|uniref:acyl carrier protein n=1 Tax=Paenibacillus massiliensis TaxID=225917 RepID=UPI000402ADE6|nr:phosphopantetheine-binding protein [Paenibacillus massiliensis]
MEQIKSRIREMLSQFIKSQDIEDHDDIFAIGDVDSLFAMQLVVFIEKEFGIEIDNDDLDLNNFKSIDAISALVANKSSVLGH